MKTQSENCTINSEEKESLCRVMLTREITNAQNQLEYIFPGIIKSATTIMNGISQAAWNTVTKDFFSDITQLRDEHDRNLGFMSAYVNVDCSTKHRHTEKDSSYTLISVPTRQTAEEHDYTFEFTLTESHSLNVVMNRGTCFLYSAYLLTHQQVQICKMCSFVSVSMYGNKQFYCNPQKSLQWDFQRYNLC